MKRKCPKCGAVLSSARLNCHKCGFVDATQLDAIFAELPALQPVLPETPSFDACWTVPFPDLTFSAKK